MQIEAKIKSILDTAKEQGKDMVQAKAEVLMYQNRYSLLLWLWLAVLLVIFGFTYYLDIFWYFGYLFTFLADVLVLQVPWQDGEERGDQDLRELDQG